MAQAFSETDRMVEKAAANVEDLLRLEAKLTGTYPKARLHTLVEEWYEQNNKNAADTLWTIQALKNKKYRVTCENYLSRLSGKTIGKIKQELLDEFNGGDVFSASSPNKVNKPNKDYWLLVFIGALVVGFVVCIFLAPQPEGIIVYGLVCLISNFFRKM